MAIHYLQSNMEGEDIALDEIRDDPTDDDDSDLQTAETGFGGTAGTVDGTTVVAPAESPTFIAMREAAVSTAMLSSYEAWDNNAGGAPVTRPDARMFILNSSDELRLKDFPNVRLTYRTGGDLVRAYALSSIQRDNPSIGLRVIRDELGYENYGLKTTPLADAVADLQKGSDNLEVISTEAETVEMRDLGTTAGKASSIVETMETTFSDASLPLREIRGLDKALQTIRGELVNNLAKLTELDNHITREQNKLDEPDIGDFERRRIAERIRDLKDERVSRLEAASASREALRSQISRIRETINRLINEDTTLAERIRTLFREQGITIVSILTALGMVISTLVLAVSGGSAAVVPPTPPSKGGLREWVKKYLHALGRVLAKLAAKAGAALPGIIGSVVGWLLNLLSKTVGWLASNLWALMLAVGGILLIAAREWLAIR